MKQSKASKYLSEEGNIAGLGKATQSEDFKEGSVAENAIDGSTEIAGIEFER